MPRFPASQYPVPAQPVDATPANRLIGQNFSQGSDLSELYSIKPKPDSIFRLTHTDGSPRSPVAPALDLRVDLLVQLADRARADPGTPQRFGDVFDSPHTPPARYISTSAGIAEKCGPVTGQMMPLVEGAQRQQTGVTGDLASGKITVNGTTAVEGETEL
jgi:hypothetical protein